ncbi:MAG: BON domain-containing protein [Aquabacterium sp.]
MMSNRFERASWRRVGLAAALASTLLAAGCAPLLVGGAVFGTGLVFVDRRTSGAQLEDQAIELKAGNRVREAVAQRGHANVASYNRMVLITGEAATDADKAAIEQAVSRVENVRSTVNELAVMGASSLTARSGDAVLTTRVKAGLIDASDLQATAFKVVTERSVVYLMGRVTEREGNRAAEVARGISGVAKVVKVFETLTEAELAAMQPKK